MGDRENRLAWVIALAERMHTGHCWNKTPDGPRRRDLAFSAQLAQDHVDQHATYGLCPIAPGSSTCRVACLDLDSHKGEVPWERMLAVADEICTVLDMIHGMKPHAFRSSGGSGIHIYLTWQEPQDAFSVRTLLKSVLDDCNLKSGTKGVASREVEIFPKQNEVKEDGFGSMFILPFAGRSEPIGDFQRWNDSAPVPLRTREERSAASSTASALPEIARIKSALDAIPNTGAGELDYDAWRNITFAVHAATDGSDVGLDLVHEFSARSSKYDSDFINNRHWPYIRNDRDGPLVTAGTLFAAASRLGWEDPGVLDDFDVVANDAPALQPASTEARFCFEHESAFVKRPPPEYHVKDVIPDADLVVVYGEPGSGKTFLALDIAAAVMRGEPWRGDKRVRQGRVAYIAAEGSGGFRNRIVAYKNEHKLEALDLFVLADSPSFREAAHVKDVIKRLREIGPVSLVVVDTLSQVGAGGDENSSEDMGKIILHCRMIRKHTGATVILIHHSGKDAARGARGHSSLRGAADAEIEILRSEHDRVATVKKQKDGEDGMEFGFKLRTTEIGLNADGDMATSCVIDHGAAVKNIKKKAARLGPVEDIVLRVLRDAIGLGTGDEKPKYGDVLKAAADMLTPPAEGERNQRPGRVSRAVEGLISKGLVMSGDGRVWLAVSGE